MMQPVSEASDAYSFAMVILEVWVHLVASHRIPTDTYQIFTGRVPFHDCIPTTVIVDVSSGYRPQRPADPNLHDDLWHLTEQCWSHDPQDRPRISEVILRLQAILASRSRDRISQDDTTLGSFRQARPSFGKMICISFSGIILSCIRRPPSSVITANYHVK